MWMPLIADGWMNPNMGLVAVIVQDIQDHGSKGEALVRDALRALGRRNAHAILRDGHVDRDAGPVEWGRFTLKLMNMTGFMDYAEISAEPDYYAFEVRTYPYTEAFEYLEAPPQTCDIPGDWDRGCIETINPSIEMLHPRCLWRGDQSCVWEYRIMSTANEETT